MSSLARLAACLCETNPENSSVYAGRVCRQGQATGWRRLQHSRACGGQPCCRQHALCTVRVEAPIIFGQLCGSLAPILCFIHRGKSFQQAHMHVHDIHSFVQNQQGSEGAKADFTHTINHLSFGKVSAFANPLDGTTKKTPDGKDSRTSSDKTAPHRSTPSSFLIHS